MQPIVVRSLQDGVFQLIAGERRWRAAQIAGLHRLPALVRESEDHHTLELALVENLQREGLNPIDEARAYQRLLSEFNLKQEQVAERVGKSRASVANMLRLLKLPAKVQELLLEEKLTVGHAKALLALDNDNETAILDVALEIIKEKYSVRQAEAVVSRSAGTEKKSRDKATEDPNVRAALIALERALGTKVTIQGTGKGKGKIEIHFHSEAERDRLYNGLVEARF